MLAAIWVATRIPIRPMWGNRSLFLFYWKVRLWNKKGIRPVQKNAGLRPGSHETEEMKCWI